MRYISGPGYGRSIYRKREEGGAYTHSIAKVSGDPRRASENEANACLIAAAPILLGALEKLLAFLEAPSVPLDFDKAGAIRQWKMEWDEYDEVVQTARNAITLTQ